MFLSLKDDVILEADLTETEMDSGSLEFIQQGGEVVKKRRDTSTNLEVNSHRVSCHRYTRRQF